MSALYDSIVGLVQDLKAEYVKDSADGSISLADLWALVQIATADLVKTAEALNIAGADKKQLVMDALSELWDLEIANLKITGIPPFLMNLAEGYLKPLVMNFASGTIDALVKILGFSSKK